MAAISILVERYGLKLNRKKTRFCGKGNRMTVTGVVINQKLQPSRVWRKATRAKLHRMSKAQRITRRDVGYLQGVKGVSGQYLESPQMCALSLFAADILKNLSHTVIWKSESPVLPKALTLRQAEALASLQFGLSISDVASRLRISEAALNKRLKLAFKKIDAENINQAISWANANI